MQRGNFVRKVAYVLASLGGYTALITAAKGVLDLFGRGDTLVKSINSLPFWLNLPFVGALTIAVALWIIWRDKRRSRHEAGGILDVHGRPYRVPVHAFRAFGISVGTGLLLGTLTLCIMWVAFHRIEFEVRVNQGRFATVGEGPSMVTIALTKVEPMMEAEKFSIIAVLQCEGRADVQVRNPEPGQSYNYPDEHGYRIKFSTATSEQAIFLVSKNPGK